MKAIIIKASMVLPMLLLLVACAAKPNHHKRQIHEDFNTYTARGSLHQCTVLLSKARFALKKARKNKTVVTDNSAWSKPAELIGSAKLAKAAGDYLQCSVKARDALKYIDRGKRYMAWKEHLSS